MRKKEKGMWTVGVLAVIAILVFFAARTGSIPVQHVVLKKQDALETVLASGRVAGRNVIQLSFQQQGIVAKITAREGASVRAGDTLATLDNRRELNIIEQRRNALNISRINLRKLLTTDSSLAALKLLQAISDERLAKTQLERSQALFDQKVLAQSELEQAQHQYEFVASNRQIAENALAELNAGQRQLQLSQVRQAEAMLGESYIGFSKTILQAPENGTIVRRLVNMGETVQPGAGAVLFLPADTTTHVELMVDEKEIPGIKAGQRALVSVSSEPGTVLEATVRDVATFVDASRGTGTVQLTLAGQDKRFIPDQTVSAQIITRQVPGALMVDQRFVTFGKTGTYVFVFRGGKSMRVPVVLNNLGNGKFMVQQGLYEGDILLFAPGLADGKKVRLAS